MFSNTGLYPNNQKSYPNLQHISVGVTLGLGRSLRPAQHQHVSIRGGHSPATNQSIFKLKVSIYASFLSTLELIKS
ncbi:hypothetical protein R1flu_015087 [Riccia fluitans]|uniref:Uncharacterized protein n=1 Tax=Riccia fluitans TaxID=41844 RepID=A0ABD1YHY1_9MARC